MILLLPALLIQLLMSSWFELEYDWEYIYIVSIFSLVSSMILISAQEIKGRRKKESKFLFTASLPNGPLISLTFVMVLNTTINVEGREREILILQIAILAIFFSLAFIKYKFYIEENTLTFEINFFTIQLYKRIIFPEEIKHVKFIRTGWAQKSAIIKLKKGFPLRIINFDPKNVCIELDKFTDRHSISISKTKDYIRLDKYSRQQLLNGKARF
ncbi:hypothetical protein [Ureibacillus chungkukjangi]|uniref:hypothetical protein n=1 Tax=Ureibacillus chungkukjangi TaxID=1202712 RepID=UPI00203C5383|nr:hypothetical protein [Ureibacillus chungkukjangi]